MAALISLIQMSKWHSNHTDQIATVTIRKRAKALYKILSSDMLLKGYHSFTIYARIIKATFANHSVLVGTHELEAVHTATAIWGLENGVLVIL